MDKKDKVIELEEVAEEKPNRNSSGWTTLFFLVLGILFLYAMDWSFLSRGITEYPIQCPSDFHEGNGCYTLNTTTYYPDKRTQTVKTKDEFEISTLKKCTVIGRRDWECKYDDESAVFGFNGGQFHSTTLFTKAVNLEVMKKFDKETQYVSRIRYLLEKWNLM